MAVKFKRGFWIFLVLILAGGLGFVYFNFVDKQKPVIEIYPDAAFTNGTEPFELRIHDPGLGLRRVEISVVQGQEVLKTVREDFDSGVHDWKTRLNLPGLNQGDFELRVLAVDRSILNWGRGNTSQLSRQMIFDNVPPSISLATHVHNLNQGGAGLVIYTVSKEVEKTGVRLGDYFFPAYKKTDGRYYCIFSFAYDISPGDETPRIMARDRAGNEQISGFNHHVNSRSFRQADLNISDGFLHSQMPQFENTFSGVSDPFELFLRVNRDLREQNRARIMEISSRTSSAFTLEGTMKRKPSAFMAGYADHRSYYYQGEKVDQQVHLGVDLASTAQAPVPAAERGKVVFSGDLGIYGQTVILDHGLGLQTLYAHLSSIEISQGQDVERGQQLGRTGTTGLAVGDHLHFEVLVSGVSVNPAEWWDGNWLENNIFSKLRSMN